jgi:hypothetical protein
MGNLPTKTVATLEKSSALIRHAGAGLPESTSGCTNMSS